MIICLAGLPGCGKSSAGRAAAERVGCEFADLDDYISEASGLTIPELFTIHGEAHFRELESEQLEILLSRPGDMILALGGGTLTRAQNRTLVDAQSISIWLKRSPTKIAPFVDEDTQRPLMQISDTDAITRLEQLLAERVDHYQRCHHHIDSSFLSVQETGDAIADIWFAANSNTG